MSYQKQNAMLIGVTKQLALPLSAKVVLTPAGNTARGFKKHSHGFLSLPGTRLKLLLTSLTEEKHFTLNGLKLRVLYQ